MQLGQIQMRVMASSWAMLFGPWRGRELGRHLSWVVGILGGAKVGECDACARLLSFNSGKQKPRWGGGRAEFLYSEHGLDSSLIRWPS